MGKVDPNLYPQTKEVIHKICVKCAILEMLCSNVDHQELLTGRTCWAFGSLCPLMEMAQLTGCCEVEPQFNYLKNGFSDGLAVNFGEMELNGNCTVNRSNSLEDLSEYTDADESISAPTEILAEFLSAVMLKDYETALKYCKIILQYEPNHVTAKEFYPLIQEKLNQAAQNESNHNEESESTSSSSADNSEDEGEDDEGEVEVEGEVEAEGDDEEEVSEEYSSGSGGDSSGGLGNSSDDRRNVDSDATTASYSSLEDEEAGNPPPSAARRPALNNKHDNDSFFNNSNNNSNKTATSDSESPTEPVSQRVLPTVLAVRL